LNVFDIISVNNIVAFLLILFRVAGIFFVPPLLGNKAVPPQVQVPLSLMLALMLVPQLQYSAATVQSSDILLIKLILQEVTIGVIIGFAAALVFAVVQVAGEIFGMKVGFAIAQIIDPANEGSAGLLTSFYVLIGGLIFLYLDGHHVILQALYESFQFIPVGEGISLLAGNALTDILVKIFAVGIKMAAPVIAVMTLLYMAFGFITKLSPQMNIYFTVGFILGPVLGILTLMLSLPLFRVLMVNMTNDLGPELIKVVHALKGA